MARLADDRTVAERILRHIDRGTTDESDAVWREPVGHYRSPERFAAELAVLRRTPTPFCPSAALAEPGAYVARDAAGTPILAVRGPDGRARAFRNACRHRGTQLASGAGCEKAFVCRYHGWTYDLDGALRHVPHERGFPGLDKRTHGLVPVATIERQGLVFVTQDGGAAPDDLVDELGGLLGRDHRLLAVDEREVAANWKVVVEGFLEGYHIRETHRETFFPIQYDNVNVVEAFGPHSRIAFPYRRIERLRAVSPDARTIDGLFTLVYHLFPNAMLATFPHTVVVVAVEPLAIDRTLLVTSTLARPGRDDVAGAEAIRRSGDFVVAGAAEDRAVACAVQRGLASGANDCFEFGRFEGAIAHFHRTLDAALDAASGARRPQARRA
jgi:phenylpropionate dioxygenase-like ring-hydroxylating dioxygenase large terminal subunit